MITMVRIISYEKDWTVLESGLGDRQAMDILNDFTFKADPEIVFIYCVSIKGWYL